MLERDHPALSIRGQCRLLGIARSGVYRPDPANDDEDLALMRRIDALFTAWPFLGSRRMTAMLRADGLTVNRKRVQRLMRRMGIAALGPKPRTTKPAPGHKIFPYLLRDLGDCQDFRVRAGFHHAKTNRSSKRMANWVLAMLHSRGGIFQSFAARFNTRKRSLSALSSVGKCPLVLAARRSLAFKLSIEFVV